MRFLRIFLLVCTLSLLTALPASAAGLIPCGSDGEPMCQACHIVQMGQKILVWIISIMTSIIAFIFMLGGFNMVMAGSNPGRVGQAKSMMTKAVVGFVILLASWLIIDTFLKFFVDTGKIGTWNEIKCVDQPEYAWNPNQNTSRGVSASTPTESALPSAVGAVGSYKNQLCTIAANAGVGSECSGLLAIMTQESGGDPNAKSPAGAVGLMQVTPNAARSLDSSLQGLSDAEISKKLLDPTYNMQVAVKYYDGLVDKFGKDTDSIYAAYNGGVGATQPSKDCPGQERWQCVWDSPGCYGTSNTNCTKNTGYAETRDYVQKVTKYRSLYDS